MVKERKNLGLGLLPIAAIFLFNPSISGVIDPLPDVLGYFLLFIGLREPADLNYHIEEALNFFKKMIAVSAAQFLSMFWLFGFCPPKERPVATLLIAFTVAVFEIVFLSKAYREMFEGFLYLGSRHGSRAMFELPKHKKEKSERNATTRILKFTLFFVIAKAVITTLPEFAALTLSNYDDTSPVRFLYDYISLLRTFAMFILLPICIIWLVKFWRYIRSLLRDIPFITEITEKYRAEVLPKDEMFLKRAIHVGTIILCVGICFSLDIYIDYLSVLPDFLCPLIMLIGFFTLKSYLGKGSLFPLCAVANLLSSVAVYIYSIYFYDHFTMSLALYSERALLAYYVFCILKITDAIFFFAMIFSLLPSFRHIIEKYTGFAPLNAANFHSEDKLQYVHSTLNKRVPVLFPLAILSALGSILYILLVRHVNFMWLIEFSFSLAFVFFFISTLRAITNEVDYKYLLS